MYGKPNTDSQITPHY